MHKKAFFDCPSCGSRCEYTIWESINASDNPEAKEALISGNLFTHKCPDCGNILNIVYSVLYQDSNHSAMVHLVSDCSDVNAEIEKFRGIRKYVVPSAEYQVRFVTAPNDLKEKATIFDAGLDDRIIELMKQKHLQQKNPSANAKPIKTYFVRDDDGRHRFELVYARENIHIDFDKNLYDDLRDELMKKRPELLTEEIYAVDSTWADKQ